MITVTVKRPNGQIETVDVSHRVESMTQDVFDKIKRHTKAAGRGDVIDWNETDTKTNDEKAS